MKKYLKRIVYIVIIFTIGFLTFNYLVKNKISEDEKKEIELTKTYKKYTSGDDYVEGTDNVRFNVFFLRDTNGDGEAEKLYGSVNEIGKQSPLYFELNVLGDGELKNSKIEILGNNFYLQTSLIKDTILKSNYISNNTQLIEFKNIGPGTQKLFYGQIRSGDYTYTTGKNAALQNDNSNYSRNDNIIRFTGTYYPYDGEPIEISKDVNLTVDWYGNIYTEITNLNQKYNNSSKNLDTLLSNNETLNIEFNITTNETKKELLVKENYVEATIPKLNGYSPLEVKVNSSYLDYEYNDETSILKIDRKAKEDNLGRIVSSVSSTNSYSVTVKYPKNAYSDFYDEDNTSFQLNIPVREYYIGYNNSNFENPIKSNIASSTVKVIYEKYVEQTQQTPVINDSAKITVGTYMTNPYVRQVVSKIVPLKVYKGIDLDSNVSEYITTWVFNKGNTGSTNKIVFKDIKTDEFIDENNNAISMNNITSYKGIYFNDLSNSLDDEAEIKIYDDETNELLIALNKDTIKKYSSKEKQYMYSNEIKHIRLEVTGLKKSRSIYIYNVKNIDVDYLVSNYTLNEFNKLKNIKSYVTIDINDNLYRNMNSTALYEAPYSIATLDIDEKIYSTIETTNTNIIVNIQNNIEQNILGFTNGIFLIKLPEDIATTDIKSVVSNNNEVEILSYEYIENENGKFIKVITDNPDEQGFKIIINADLSPNRKALSGNHNIELYASSELAYSYYYKKNDQYDTNNNLNINELVDYSKLEISILSPNNLITSETVTDYDNNQDDEIAISPQIANVDKEEDEATITVEIQNNYDTEVSNISILGRIPFEGNKYIITGLNMNSEFNTTILSKINIPDDIKDSVKIYYSENENATNDLNDESNGWIKDDDITSFTNIKSYLIDMTDIIMQTGDSYNFSYKIQIPRTAKYNEETFGGHAVYFAIMTADGKYKTRTETSKVGLRIVKKYNLNLNKYQKNKNKLVSGATYSVTEIIENNDNESYGSTKTATTDSNGNLIIKDLLVEKEYEIKEIKSPNNYMLNDNTIRLYGYVDEDNKIVIDKKSGDIKGELDITRNSTTYTTVKMNVEDEVLASLKILKTSNDNNQPLKNIKYKITGPNYGRGRILFTDNEGIASINNLIIGETYTLEEYQTEGYYKQEPVQFKILNDEGTYIVQIIDGTVKSSNVTEINDLPVLELNIEGEKIPTYTLNLTKVKEISEINVSQSSEQNNQEETNYVYLKDAVFYLYRNGKKIGEYTTDNNGKITINNLYVYNSEKDVDATYMLREVATPTGYAKVKDIVFKTELENDKLKFIETLQSGQSAKTYTSDNSNVNLLVEDMPSFKLVKKDGETGELLANVKFAFYNIDAGEVPARDSKNEIIGTKVTIDGKDYYVLETDEHGEITVDLPEGLYKALEVEADDKYDLTGKVYYFGIGASRESEVLLGTEFIKVYNGTGTDNVVDMAKTKDGGYILLGKFNGTLTLGNNQYTTNGNYDVYIARYNSNDELEFVTTFGGTANETPTTVEVLENGDYLVGGYFEGANFFIGDNEIVYKSPNRTSFLARYSSNNELIYAKSIYGGRGTQLENIVARPDGGYFLTGSYDNSLTIGDKFLDGGNNSVYLAIVNADDEVEMLKMMWTYGWGGSISQIINLEDGGYIIGGNTLGGSTQVGVSATIGRLQLGDYVLRFNQLGGFIARYNSDNEVVYAEAIDAPNSGEHESVYRIINAKDGGYYVAGSITGNYTLQDKSLIRGIYILKYNSNNEIVAYKNYAAQATGYLAGPGSINGLVELENGNVIMTVSNGSNYMYEYDSSLNQLSSRSVTNAYIDVELFDDKYIFVGNTSYKVGFDNIELTVSGNHTFRIKRGYRDEYPVSVEKYDYPNSVQDDSIASTIVTDDDEIIMYANTSSYYAADYNGTPIKGRYFAKIKSDGTIEKIKEINLGYVSKIIQNKNKEIIAVGYISGNLNLNSYTLRTKGNYDAFIIKLDEDFNVLYAKSFGGTGYDYATDIVELKNGGYILSGYSTSEYFSVDNNDFYRDSSGQNGFIVALNENFEVDYLKSYRGSSIKANTVSALEDGSFVVGGIYKNKLITDELNKESTNSTNGFVIRYSPTGNIEFDYELSCYGDYCVTQVIKSSDGGYLVGGASGTSGSSSYIYRFNRNNEIVAKYNLMSGGLSKYDSFNETSDGGIIAAARFSSNIYDNYKRITGNRSIEYALVKFNADGKVQFMKPYQGEGSELVNSITELSDGSFFVTANSSSNPVNIVDKQYGKLESGTSTTSYNDIHIFKLIPAYDAAKQNVVEAVNERKVYKITTGITKIDDIEGGTISGSESMYYEKVLYGDTNTKDIVITPNPDYEIISIQVNGKDFDFTPNEDGSYTMPKFENITEDKDIKVKFAYKNNKVIINKIDSYTKEKINQFGIGFKLDQIEERELPENPFGNLTDNSASFTEPDLTKPINGRIGSIVSNGEVTLGEIDETEEITGVLGTLTNNGTYYFIERDGKYVPTNSKTYQLEQGFNSGKHNTTANSYIEIDLTNKTGIYVVKVNASVSSQSSSDFGYISITDRTNATAYNDTYNRMLYISGSVSDKDYNSVGLQGGKKYYLHLGYYKNGGTDSGDDQLVVNSIKVYKASGTTYSFVAEDNKYVSNNTNVANSTAASYVKIDLTGLTGTYKAVVNASISSQENSDYGYATISNTTNRLVGGTTFMNISGNKESRNYYAPTLLEGGKIYYLHLYYYKNGSTNTGNDQFIVNSIKLYETKDVEYNFIEQDGTFVSTNENISSSYSASYVPLDLTNNYGKYNLIINYTISSQSSDDYGYIYITQSTDRVDTTSATGRIGYVSGSSTNKYTYVVQGGKKYYIHFVYKKNDSKDAGEDKFKINSLKLELNDSELYHTHLNTNNLGQAIGQIPFGKYQVVEENAPVGYYLNEEPMIIEFRSNEGAPHEFNFEDDIITSVTVHHYLKDEDGNYTDTKLSEDEIIYGKIGDTYNTSPNMNIDNYDLERNEEEYVTPINNTGEFTFENIDVNYYYEKGKIPLRVRHYIEGSITPVKLQDGSDALDYVSLGRVNEPYETHPLSDEELSDKYELSITPDNSSGLYLDEETIVTYYYKEVKRKVNITTEDILNGDKIANTKYKVYTDIENPIEISDLYKGNNTYYFVEENGKYKNNNQRKTTPANSYIKIDLTNANRDYRVIVNANISGRQSYDIGYATITTSETIPSYNNGNGRFIYISGNISNRDYTSQVLTRGNIYYLHLGYRKSSTSSSGTDTFTINSIRLEDTEPSYTTDSNGNIDFEFISGTYYISQVDVPNRYKLNEEKKEITINRDSDLENNIIFKNERRKGKVIVHHYLEGTTEHPTYEDGSEVQDEIKEDYVDESYATKPIPELLNKYTVLTDIPENSSGEYTPEDLEVIYYYKDRIYNYKVEYYYNNVLDETKTEEKEAKYLDLIETFDDKKGNYVLIDTENYPLSITQDNLVIKVYYKTEYNLNTSVTKHEEHYSDGNYNEVTGGIISGDGTNPYEIIRYGDSNTKDIVITPNIGYEISKLTINNQNVDFSSLLDEAGSITLPAGYFSNVDSNIDINVEFRKKVQITVRYLEKDTNEVLFNEIILNGYDGDSYTTERKNISNYRSANVQTGEGLSNVTIDGKIYNETIDNKFYSNNQVITYWYELIPDSTIVVKHIEVDYDDINNGLTMSSGSIIDEESYTDKVNTEITTNRKEIVDNDGIQYLSTIGPVCNNCNKVIIDKDTNTYSTNIEEDNIIEIRYYYLRKYSINVDSNLENGTITGNDIVIRNSSNINPIVITPNPGYRVKKLLINNTITDFEENTNHVVVLEPGALDKVTGNVNISAEFERIPAKVIIKYIDEDKNTEIIPSKTINGYVGDTYSDNSIIIDGYRINNNDSVTGIMTENDITIKYLYKKKIKISSSITGHIENIYDKIIIPTGPVNEREENVYGGTINNSNIFEENLLYNQDSLEDIIIKANEGYIISSILVNGEEVEITNNQEIILDKFTNVINDINIKVSFERIKKIITVNCIDEKGNIIDSYEQEVNYGDNYEILIKDIDKYKYVGNQNINGIVYDDIVIECKYEKIKNIKGSNENPNTYDGINKYIIIFILNLAVLIGLIYKRKLKN